MELESESGACILVENGCDVGQVLQHSNVVLLDLLQLSRPPLVSAQGMITMETASNLGNEIGALQHSQPEVRDADNCEADTIEIRVQHKT